MIVKNESHCILETLECMYRYIDYYVICDTGSTDDTKKVIKTFFDSKNIKGEIYDHEWKNFGHNRSLAMQCAYKKSEYLWVMDADDLIVGDLKLPKYLTADSYNLTFGLHFTYERPLIFNNKLKWEFKGVLHEFANCVSKKTVNSQKLTGNFYIESRRLGDRNKDPEKYKKDALLLMNAIENKIDPDLKDRYIFYTGQSWKDYGDYEKAIEWYNKRIATDGWLEEVYYSMLQVGYCLDKLNKPIDEIEKIYLRAFKYIYDRCEALYEFALVCINRELYEIALKYLLLADRIKYPENKYVLFVNKYVYDVLIKFELCKVAVKLNKYDLFTKYSNYLTFNYNPDNNIKQQLSQFKIKIYTANYGNKFNVNLPIVKSNDEKKIIFTMTTCKRYNLFEQTMYSFINCCLDYHLIDKWYIVDDNSSIEDREKMRNNFPFVEFVNKGPEDKGHVKSMNMIRDYIVQEGYQYQIHLEDDWLFYKPYHYITDALKLINIKEYNFIDEKETPVFRKNELINRKIKQVLFNKNYAEVDEIKVYGGYLCKFNEKLSSGIDTYIVHEYINEKRDKEHYDKQFAKYPGNCLYWPYYSFRPSLTDTSIYKELGNYEQIGFFEREYANKYYDNNYISIFFDDIVCRHIGKLTSDRSENVLNAYELNNVDQGKGNDNKSINLNLPKLKESLETNIKAIENEKKYKLYKKLIKPPKSQSNLIENYKVCKLDNTFIDFEFNNEITYLFSNNDFDYNKEVISDLYKHFTYWHNLKKDFIYDTYVIINTDNVTYNIEYINEIIQDINSKNGNYDLYVLDKYTQFYIIRKHAVLQLFEYIDLFGIYSNLNKFLPNIVKNLYQYDIDIFNIYSKYHIEYQIRYKYEFIPYYDSVGNDICQVRNTPIEKIMDITNNIEEVICFNTLGYLKTTITNELSRMDFFKDNNSLLHKKDGIYIHREKYYRKYKNHKLVLNLEDYDFYENVICDGDIIDKYNGMLYEIKEHCDKNYKYEAFTTNGDILCNVDSKKTRKLEANDIYNIWNGTFVKKTYSKKNKWDILQRKILDRKTFEIYIDKNIIQQNLMYIINYIEQTLVNCYFVDKYDNNTTDIICVCDDNFITLNNIDNKKQITIYINKDHTLSISEKYDIIISTTNNNCNKKNEKSQCRRIYLPDILDIYNKDYENDSLNTKSTESCYIKDYMSHTNETDIKQITDIKELYKYRKLYITENEIEDINTIDYVIQSYKHNIDVYIKTYNNQPLNITNIKNKYCKNIYSELNINKMKVCNYQNKSNRKGNENNFKSNMDYYNYVSKNVIPEFKKVFYSN